MDTMLTYNTNSKTGPVCGGRAREKINYVQPVWFKFNISATLNPPLQFFLPNPVQ